MILAYTLTGPVIFTVVITCASLVGWIKFADAKQQSKLFYVLIVELIAVAVGFYSQNLMFNPVQVQGNITTLATNQVLAELPKDQRNITLIRLFWRPGGKADPSRYAVLREWLTAHGFNTDPGESSHVLKCHGTSVRESANGV